MHCKQRTVLYKFSNIWVICEVIIEHSPQGIFDTSSPVSLLFSFEGIYSLETNIPINTATDLVRYVN